MKYAIVYDLPIKRVDCLRKNQTNLHFVSKEIAISDDFEALENYILDNSLRQKYENCRIIKR